MSALPPSSQAPVMARSLEDLRRERLEKLLAQARPLDQAAPLRLVSPPGIQHHRR